MSKNSELSPLSGYHDFRYAYNSIFHKLETVAENFYKAEENGGSDSFLTEINRILKEVSVSHLSEEAKRSLEGIRHSSKAFLITDKNEIPQELYNLYWQYAGLVDYIKGNGLLKPEKWQGNEVLSGKQNPLNQLLSDLNSFYKPLEDFIEWFHDDFVKRVQKQESRETLKESEYPINKVSAPNQSPKEAKPKSNEKKAPKKEKAESLEAEFRDSDKYTKLIKQLKIKEVIEQDSNWLGITNQKTDALGFISFLIENDLVRTKKRNTLGKLLEKEFNGFSHSRYQSKHEDAFQLFVDEFPDFVKK